MIWRAVGRTHAAGAIPKQTISLQQLRRYRAAGTFARYTIPIRMRVGWYFGTDRFESEGEFFRVTIDDGVYR
jgi:hypothetical protein